MWSEMGCFKIGSSSWNIEDEIQIYYYSFQVGKDGKVYATSDPMKAGGVDGF